MPRRKRGVSSKLPSRVRLLGFLPLAVVLLERLWVPMQMSRSPSPAYFSSARSKDNKRLDNEKIPRLADVTKTTGDWMKCPSKTRMVEKSIAPQRPGATSTIPLTGETKCLAPALYDATTAWRKAVGYSYGYWFHDIHAVNRLLNLDFPEFPLLRSVLRRCIKGYELKISLWKYLVLYTYGGVFVELGLFPEQINFDFSVLTNEDAICFVGGNHNWLIPDVIAVAPKHPLVYYALHHYLLGVLMETDIDETNRYRNISIQAMNAAIVDFTSDAGTNSTQLKLGETLLGTDDRTVMLLDHKGELGIIFNTTGGKYMQGMFELQSMSTSKSHERNWRGSCVSEIVSGLG